MKTLKINTNLIFGIVAVILSILLWLIIPSQVPPSLVATEYINGSFMPKLMAGIMFVCGIIGIIRGIFFDKHEKTLSISLESKSVCFLIIFALFVVLATKVSFLISAVLFGIISLAFMKCRNIKKYIAVVAVIVAVCLIFKFGLKVRFGGLWGI